MVPGSLPRLVFLLGDPLDRAAVHEVLAALPGPLAAQIVADRPALESLLHREGPADLLFLDLAVEDGLLRALRASPATRRTVMLGLSHAWSQAAIDRAHDDGANAYLTLPLSQSGLLDLLTRALDFWLGCAQLPARARA